MKNKFDEYEKDSLFRDNLGKISSKRIAGFIGFVLFITLTIILFVYSLNDVVADPETELKLLEMIAFLSAGLLGVGVFEGFGKRINKRNRNQMNDYDEVRRNRRSR